MKLTFSRSGVQHLLSHAQSAPGARPSYVERFGNIQPRPGLWLVGDQGVYLMSNGDPPLPCDGFHCVYAREINPLAMPFDDWWANKRLAFGGDDGIEVLDLALIRRSLAACPGDLIIDCTPKKISLKTIQLH